MPRTTKVTISFDMDDERLNALNLYLTQNEQSLNELLTATLISTTEKLFLKTVPKEVQSFLMIKNNEPSAETSARRTTRRNTDDTSEN